MDKPQYQFKKSDKLPGEVYSPTMQCKLTFGKQSSLCPFKVRSKKGEPLRNNFNVSLQIVYHFK